MKQKNLKKPIPATLIHEVKGRKFQLEGTITAINESAGVCTMKFGDKVNSNVPLKEVYINEGLIDDIKNVGKKIWGGIKGFVKSIGGFLVPVDENGVANISLANNPISLVGMSLPEGVYYAPTQDVLDTAEQAGLDVVNDYTADDLWDQAIDRERDEIDTYWTRVMREYVENESLDIENTIRYVNEKYYHTNITRKQLNEINNMHAKGNPLNETIATITNMNDNGDIKSAAEIKSLVCANLFSQLTPISDLGEYEGEYLNMDDMIAQHPDAVQKIKDHVSADYIVKYSEAAEGNKSKVYDPFKNMNTAEIANYIRKQKEVFPVLVWGAPGIGKTAILKDVNRDMNKTLGYNMNMIQVMCSHLQADTFSLPTTAFNTAGQKITGSTPKSWLPVFDPNACKTDKALIETNRLYNSGAYKVIESDPNMIQKLRNMISPDKGISQADMIAQRNEEQAKRAKEYNNGKSNEDRITGDFISVANNGNSEKKYNGGVLFFDEFDRAAQAQSKDILMAICSDRKMEGGGVLATNWCICCASNRAEDEKMKQSERVQKGMGWSSAALQRFIHVTYVPTIPEWLAWARSTDRNGRQNVSEKICNFIEISPAFVFYSAIELYTSEYKEVDHQFSRYDDFKKDAERLRSGVRGDQLEDYIKRGKTNTKIGLPNDPSQINFKKEYYTMNMGNWSPRTWASQVQPILANALKQIFNEGFHEESLDCTLNGKTANRRKTDLLLSMCYTTRMHETKDKVRNEITKKTENKKVKTSDIDDMYIFYVLQGIDPNTLISIDEKWYGDANSTTERDKLENGWFEWVKKNEVAITKEYPLSNNYRDTNTKGANGEEDTFVDRSNERIDLYMKPENRLAVLNAYVLEKYSNIFGVESGVQELYRMYDKVFSPFTPTELKNIITTGYASWEKNNTCVEYNDQNSVKYTIKDGDKTVPNNDVWKKHDGWMQRICNMLMEYLYKGVPGWSATFNEQVLEDMQAIANLQVPGPDGKKTVQSVITQKGNGYTATQAALKEFPLSTAEKNKIKELKDKYTIKMKKSYDATKADTEYGTLFSDNSKFDSDTQKNDVDLIHSVLDMYNNSRIAKALLNITFFMVRAALSVHMETRIPVFINMIWNEKWAELIVKRTGTMFQLVSGQKTNLFSLDFLMGDVLQSFLMFNTTCKASIEPYLKTIFSDLDDENN